MLNIAHRYMMLPLDGLEFRPMSAGEGLCTDFCDFASKLAKLQSGETQTHKYKLRIASRPFSVVDP